MVLLWPFLFGTQTGCSDPSKASLGKPGFSASAFLCRKEEVDCVSFEKVCLRAAKSGWVEWTDCCGGPFRVWPGEANFVVSGSPMGWVGSREASGPVVRNRMCQFLSKFGCGCRRQGFLGCWFLLCPRDGFFFTFLFLSCLQHFLPAPSAPSIRSEPVLGLAFESLLNFRPRNSSVHPLPGPSKNRQTNPLSSRQSRPPAQ